MKEHGSGAGSEAEQVRMLAARAEIEGLAARYAHATDALGRGALEEGKRLYRNIFTEDAILEFSYFTDEPGGPPDLRSTGSDAWAEMAYNSFRELGYINTQHLIGSITVDIEGTTATMTSHVTATHVIGLYGPVDLGSGTYHDRLVHTPEGWRIKHHSLHITSVVRIEGDSGSVDMPGTK